MVRSLNNLVTHLWDGAEGHGVLEHRDSARVVAQVRRVVPAAADAAAAAAAHGSGSQRRQRRQVPSVLHLAGEGAVVRASHGLTKRVECTTSAANSGMHWQQSIPGWCLIACFASPGGM